jgi:hypothetical protein
MTSQKNKEKERSKRKTNKTKKKQHLKMFSPENWKKDDPMAKRLKGRF